MSFQLPKSAHNLSALDVSVNKFNHLFPENIGWILPHLEYLKLAHNGFQGNLPSSLGNMEAITYLDVSHNSFQGKLPRNFMKDCHLLQNLKLSQNKLSGEVFQESTIFGFLMFNLTMDNNQFTGKIGQGMRSLTSLQLLDISNNNFSSFIPSWIGELQSLHTLLLSNNSLEGEIPVSLFNISFLGLVDLSANSLSGHIPPHVTSVFGAALFLQDNNLAGTIPDSLLGNVTVLDLRNNRLSGNIPEFTNTQSISFLLLRGNDLTGCIPRQLCGLTNLHLLDLANNRLNGSIPPCLSNTSFGLGKRDAFYVPDISMGETITSFEFDSYLKEVSTSPENVGNFRLVLDSFIADAKGTSQTKVEFATKNRYDAYMSGILKYLYGLDLSENELSGDIPSELGDLVKLQSLNLSHNLSGVIPNSFSGLKNVESHDLFYNRLQGWIPSQLTDLSRLAVFNLSYNNFSGIIPEGRQFNTFDIQSYLGNPLLCGKQTNTSCNRFLEPGKEVKDDESTIDMVSFYWSFAAAYVTILVGIFTSLSFDSPWRRFWFHSVNVFIHKVRNLF